MAQKRLHSTFGMELVELSSRAGLDRDAFDGEDVDDNTAVGLKKKGKHPS